MEIDGTMKQSIVQSYQWKSLLISPWMIMTGPKIAKKFLQCWTVFCVIRTLTFGRGFGNKWPGILSNRKRRIENAKKILILICMF